MNKKISPEFAAGEVEAAGSSDDINSLDQFPIEVLEAALCVLKAQQERRRQGDVCPG